MQANGGVKKRGASTVRPHTPGTPRLSEAAMRLAAKVRGGGRTPLDSQLRATYKGTPLLSRNATPGQCVFSFWSVVCALVSCVCVLSSAVCARAGRLCVCVRARVCLEADKASLVVSFAASGWVSQS